MAKPSRFERRVDCWMSPQLADLTQSVAEHQEVTSSAVIRMALKFYFEHIGAVPEYRSPHGQHQAQ